MNVPLLALYLGAAVAGASVALVVWRRREVPGGRALVALMTAASWWALCDALDLLVTSIPAHRVVSQIQYVGVVSSGPLLVHVAFHLAGQGRRLTPPSVVALWTMPVVTLAVASTSAWHGWLWSSIDPQPGGGAVYHYGWFFWVYASWHYLVAVFALAVVCVGARRAAAPVRGSLGLFTLAMALPYVASVVYNLKLAPWTGVDWTSVTMNLSAALLAWGILREGLLELVPVARETLIETMSDAALLVAPGGRVLLANPAADALFGLDGRGGPRIALEAAGSALDPAAPPASWTGEVLVEANEGPGRWYDVRADAVADRWGVPAARLVRLHDITERKAHEAERERLISELRTAVDEIGTLERLLPICAMCKKIRDDQGYWQKLEAYLSSRIPVRFTHGLCPDCFDTAMREVETDSRHT